MQENDYILYVRLNSATINPLKSNKEILETVKLATIMKFREPDVFSSRERTLFNLHYLYFSTSFLFCCLISQGVSLYCSSVGTLFSPAISASSF